MTVRQPWLGPIATLVAAIALLLASTVAPVWAHSSVGPPAAAAGTAVRAHPPQVVETGAGADHVGVSDAHSPHAMPSAMPLFGACLAVVILTILSRRPLRLAAAALAVLLTIVAFETAVHAVHHLGDAEGAARCAVASVPSHLSGTADPPQTDLPNLSATTDRITGTDPLQLATRPLGPQRGRAPPSIAS